MLSVESSSGSSKVLSDPSTKSLRGLSSRWIAMGLVLLGVFGFVGWQRWQARLDLAEQERLEANAVPKIPTVTALGRLEPQGELIELSAPTSSQGSRVAELKVKEGDRIQQNQVVAILDSKARLEAALQKAEENVQIARAKLAQVEAGAQSGEIQAQTAEIARLEAAQEADVAAQQSTIARIEAELQSADPADIF